MKISFQTSFSRRSVTTGALTVISSVALPFLGLRPALAHQVDCPFCAMSITQDTPKQDNETTLKMGSKRLEYKCVYCALSEAKSEFPTGDLTINAPSEKTGKPVVLKRAGGKWSATPATAFFVAPEHIKHKSCNAQARAYTTKAAAQNAATTNGGKAMTLAQLNAMVK